MAGRPLAGRWARHEIAAADERYFLVLLMLLATFVVMGLAGDNVVGRAFAVMMLAVTLLLTVRTSGWRARNLRIVALVVAPAVAVVIVAGAVGADAVGRVATALVMLCFVVLAMAAIAGRMRRHPEITLKTVGGALCLYLYFGLFFAVVFSLVDQLTRGPFFAEVADATSLDYVYFSLVTLTTTGYGDLTAKVDIGRMLATSEALLGQLYLVSAVALLVGNLGRTVKRRAKGDDATGDAAGEPTTVDDKPD